MCYGGLFWHPSTIPYEVDILILHFGPSFCTKNMIFLIDKYKEYVSLLIGLYKDHGSVLRVAIIYWRMARCTRYFGTQLHGILPWADINSNGNIFLKQHNQKPDFSTCQHLNNRNENSNLYKLKQTP